MYRPRAHPHPTIRHPAYREACRRLDEALQRNSVDSCAESIELLRQTMFADVEEEERSDPGEPPE